MLQFTQLNEEAKNEVHAFLFLFLLVCYVMSYLRQGLMYSRQDSNFLCILGRP